MQDWNPWKLIHRRPVLRRPTEEEYEELIKHAPDWEERGDVTVPVILGEQVEYVVWRDWVQTKAPLVDIPFASLWVSKRKIRISFCLPQ